MIVGDKPPLDDDLLVHFGVKGMKWGVRKEQSTGTRTSEQQASHDKRVKVAKVAGATVGVAVLAAGAYYAKQHYGVSVSSLNSAANSNTAKAGAKFAEEVTKEPAGVLHSARGVYKGYTFHQKGGLVDPEAEFLKAGFGEGQRPGFFTRYGTNMEKVAATFADPQGRKDFSGRGVVHDVVLPHSLADNVNSAEDVQRVAWPLIKDTFHNFYEASKAKN